LAFDNSYTTDLEFSSNQYWSITDAAQAGLDLTGDLTIAGWFNFESIRTDGETPNMVAKFGSSGNYGYTFFINQDSASANRTKFGFGMSSTGSNYAQVQTDYQANLTLGDWYFLGMTYDASETEFRFYKNGSFVQLVDSGYTSIYNNNAQFTIGVAQVSAGVTNIDGLIDDVRVWDRVLTSDEVADLYSGDYCADDEISRWDFDNGGTDSIDGNDLTNNNSATFQSGDLPYASDNCDVTPPPASSTSTRDVLPDTMIYSSDIGMIGHLRQYRATSGAPVAYEESELRYYPQLYFLFFAICLLTIYPIYRISRW